MPEQESGYYDKLFANSSWFYARYADKTPWSSLWNTGVELLHQRQPEYVVDLGCGPGHFPWLLSQAGLPCLKRYTGYDFSSVAIDQARERLDDDRFHFIEADLREEDFTIGQPENTLYMTFEFLEHVEIDRDVLARIPAGAPVIFSVPSFNDLGHVRYFRSYSDIEGRYGDLLNLTQVPLKPGISWFSRIIDKIWRRYLCVGHRR
jgi:SAM-dependent methyltransferase